MLYSRSEHHEEISLKVNISFLHKVAFQISKSFQETLFLTLHFSANPTLLYSIFSNIVNLESSISLFYTKWKLNLQNELILSLTSHVTR
jgi:hypothetical protein